MSLLQYYLLHGIDEFYLTIKPFLTHEDKVQVRYMEGTKFLCVSSNFDCFSNKR